MHQFQSKKQILRRKKIISNMVVFGLLLILISLGLLGWLGGFFNFIGKPIWKGEKFITNSFYDNNYIFRTKASVTKENHNLIEEISNIRLSMIDYQILKKENEQLKEILGRLPSANDYILGNILVKPNRSPYDTVIIDIGSNLGIQEGNKVFVNGNIPIGNINKVYEKTSLVSLFSNPGQKTEGYIDGINASVELIGRGGGNFEMVVPSELSVDKGTIIYLPGSSSLVVAIVNEIISKPSDPFKRIISSSPVNIQNLKWVEVRR